ncbi:class I SAM-dependent methyltransferase [Chryseolinea lacunae]|uniref:Class I SAM-dependent methyltransferase n=1 Tax=Chryseolinea lacunae TaxID=2801331 RepID=A0ABS1KUR1_9BACT|nr:class I SAM-dependent methyltransferase [Chryseolinea lacunae]MBL0743186.1 class I SAM-dependent methyltransferase [Chryseolinea lacunae]
MTSEFHAIYSQPQWKDSFFLFLENVFHLYPEYKFHDLIQEAVNKHDNDEAIYKYIYEKLPGIKPFHAPLTYALPALKKQKKEMARQTLELMGDKRTLNGYAEIGSTGRYISQLKKHVKVSQPIYLIHDLPASNSLDDIMERGGLFKIGKFVKLENYRPIPPSEIKDESLDMVTCYIGLHHCTPDVLDGFVDSIHRVLRKGGLFILRDHDVKTDQMSTFVSLVHTVFNVGTDISWAVEHADYKKFKSAEGWSDFLQQHGFADSGKRILQHKDPSLNTLMAFIKK